VLIRLNEAWITMELSYFCINKASEYPTGNSIFRNHYRCQKNIKIKK